MPKTREKRLIEHKGYIVRQRDNRVVIWKDGSVVYRAKTLWPLSRKQMVAMVEWQDLTKRRNTDDQNERKADQAD